MLRRLQQFRRDRRGLAAVEFALIAPVMIVMFYGAVEVSSAVDCNSRVARVSSTVADLVAQSTSVSAGDVSNIFAAAGAILYPYSSTGAKITVTSLADDGAGHINVVWSKALNTSPRTTVPANLPSGIIGSGGSAIYAEVQYTFTPAISYFLGGSVTLSSQFYSKPRRSSSVKFS